MEEILTTHIEAWRSWKVVLGSKGPYVRSLVLNLPWPRGEQLIAECLSSKVYGSNKCFHGDDDIPTMRSLCGIYGTKDLQRATFPEMSPSYLHGRVVGRVALWGRVVEYEYGYRALYAYPLSFCGAICTYCNRLVPLEKACIPFKTEFGDAIFCREHSTSLPINPIWQELADNYRIPIESPGTEIIGLFPSH